MGNGREKREGEKGDTFITRRRATGKIERQVVFARGSQPGPSWRARGRDRESRATPRREDSRSHEWNPRCTERKTAAYGSRGTRIAALPRDHFLCKIKYCKYDGSGRTRAYLRTLVRAHIHPGARMDERIEGERVVCLRLFFSFWTDGEEGENATKSVLRSSKEHTRRR